MLKKAQKTAQREAIMSYLNPNFPLENSQGQVMQPDTLEALAHRPLNQARFFLGRDNSK